MNLEKLKRKALRIGIRSADIAISSDRALLSIENQATFYANGSFDVDARATPAIIHLISEALNPRTPFELLGDESAYDDNLDTWSTNRAVQFNEKTNKANLEIIKEYVEELLNESA